MQVVTLTYGQSVVIHIKGLFTWKHVIDGFTLKTLFEPAGAEFIGRIGLYHNMGMIPSVKNLHLEFSNAERTNKSLGKRSGF